MCPPKSKPIANIIPAATPPAEQAPKPVEIKKPVTSDSTKKGRSSLRIDLATSTVGKSGVNV